MPRSSYGYDHMGFSLDPADARRSYPDVCPYDGQCMGQCTSCQREDKARMARRERFENTKQFQEFLRGERCRYGVRGCVGQCSRCSGLVSYSGGHDFGSGDYLAGMPDYDPYTGERRYRAKPSEYVVRRPETAVERLRASVEAVCRKAR